uniref:Cell division protein n=1 Tax=Myoviridae sp. ctbEa13 TaxID=2825136 RepID=A0A8S5VBG7_9CAUD|nr:MAG TPA: cell division protein [Myoviridae sp. ctbEa13]
MYYLLNLVFITFISIVIALVYDGTTSSGSILPFLLIALLSYLFAASYATSKYYELKDHIEKLENKKEDK